jgi:cysteine desulfurase
MPGMLGFKLEALRQEGSLKGKTRPIYLDMQASNTDPSIMVLLILV